MKIASVAQVKARLSAYLKASAAAPVIVTEKGKPVAVLLGVNDDEELERVIFAHSRNLNAVLGAADRRIEEGRGVGHEDFWKRIRLSTRAREVNGSKKKRRAKT